MVRFHVVYEKLSHAFDDFPCEELGVSDEFKEQVHVKPFTLFFLCLICGPRNFQISNLPVGEN